MKIRIQDFGPIRDFTFDLDKDLHLLYGKNGTGKSYAVYCLYIVLKGFFANEEGQRIAETFIDKNEEHVKTYSRRILTRFYQEEEGADITGEIEQLLKEAFSESTKIIEDPILSSYGSLLDLNNQFSSASFSLSIQAKNFTMSLANGGHGIEISEFKLQKSFELVSEGQDGFACYFGAEYVLDGIPGDDSLMSDICRSFIWYVNFDTALRSTSLYFLPASRSGLYQGLNAFGPIIAELSKQSHIIKKKIELPTLSEPVSDYFLALSSIRSQKVSLALQDVISQIEQDILNGEVNYSLKDQRMLFNPNGIVLSLDLSSSSSMVAELSPIVTYLKYIVQVQPKSQNVNSLAPEDVEHDYTILFIEEPEAHLHPEAQVKLMEILAELPKHNIKVVMTSHSNYMFNKLTNLILEKKVDPGKVATYHMVMTDKGSVVQDDMPVTDEGIEDSNFVTVAEQLYEERMQLLDEIEE